MAEPLHKSLESLDEAGFARGVQAMRLNRPGQEPKPQQVELAGVLDAGERFNAILMPRRSTKSTTLFVRELGRCFTRPDHHAAYTAATTGKAARDRFTREILPRLERSGLGGYQVRRSAGMERIEFANGSLFQIVGPTGDEFRGQEYTTVIIDEAQDAEVEQGRDLLAAILPVMDTNPDAQLILAGTAGEVRVGNILWDQLERGRRGDGAILEYAAGDLGAEDYAEWEQVVPLLERSHPGVGNLTSLDILRSNWERMDPALFAREYLGVWGTAGVASTLFDLGRWGSSALNVDRLPEPPQRFALAMAAAPNQQSAVIVAAWRENGVAHLLVVDHQPGTRWLAARANDLALRYRTPLHYDNFGVVLVEVDKITRMRPRATLEPRSIQETTTAAAKLVEEVADGVVRHYDQEPLNAAVALAKRRAVGAKAYAYGRGDLTDDISPVEAASLALHAYDLMPVREKVRVLRPTA